MKRSDIGTNFEVETKLDGKGLSKKYVEHSLTNKEASTVLCSVAKNVGSDRAQKTSRENTRRSRAFLPAISYELHYK